MGAALSLSWTSMVLFRVKNSAPQVVYLLQLCCPPELVHYINDITFISIGSLSIKDLGVPIFKGAPKVEHLSPITDSIIQIFSRWRGHSLSLAGRCCLINSVIASSLVHSMMIYRWSKTLLHRLEVETRSYLLMGDTNRKGFCNVDWKCCCAPLGKGGFGIRSLRLVNASFLRKLAWDFFNTSDTQACFVRNRIFMKMVQQEIRDAHLQSN